MSKSKNAVAEYRNYFLPHDFPVLLLSGEYWRISSQPSPNLHFHNCLEIGICHSDSGYMAFNGKSEPLSFKAGDVTCVPRNIPHTTWSTEGTESHWSYLFIDVAEFMKNMLPNSTIRNYDLSVSAYKDYKFIFSRSEYPEIYHLAVAAVREIELQKPHYRACAAGLIMSLIIMLTRLQSEGGELITSSDNPPENAMVLSPVLDYIEDNYSKQIDVDYLAEICHLSPTHFRRLFRSIIGTNPLDFINNTRITKACDLLRSTEDSILDISEAVGFHSVSSFNRHFAENTKTTPRNYRYETLMQKENSEKMQIKQYKGWMYPEK
ncbi:MAG: AraC family transcriptional regulator [Lachnospiraceae bacterium]|nr:AraC family transcriptional regulator [Lachnospiraceae bacterium]